MTVKRLTAAVTGLCLGVTLSSCGSVSGYVSDHWPHWAGGLPAGVPPRPGDPGYDEFITRQQSEAVGAKPAGAQAKAQPAAAPPPVAAAAPPRASAPAAYAPPDDAAAAKGGLY